MKPTTLNWIPNVVPGNTGSSAKPLLASLSRFIIAEKRAGSPLLSMLSQTDYGEWHASIFFNNGWGSG